ncbi:MAG: peroxiredoxin [Pontiella sp.]
MKLIPAVLFSAMIVMFGSVAVAVDVGQQTPSFEAKDQDGNSWNLSDHLGEKHVVLYFYPAAMTGGCTKQACAYRDHYKAGEATFDVVGISGDPVQNLKWFQQAEGLNFILLSDPDGTIAKAFGVPVKERDDSITRTVNGEEVVLTRSATAARWTFIIDPEGKVVYRNNQVKPVADLGNVLGFLQGAK